MSTMTIDALRRDECQPMTTAQMESAKAQIRPRNRANVNIVPYEIYDEDGVEQVVGEVRKTIDGVKKKKPRYRATVVLASAVSNNGNIVFSSDIDQIYAISGIIKIGNNLYRQFPWLTEDYLISTNGKNDANTGAKAYIKGSYKYEAGSILTFEFTKTTDEWEEADE